MNSNILTALLLFFFTHIIIWLQVNGQFVWSWCKDNPILMSLIGFPISYLLIVATKYIVVGFDGLLWPGRLVGFGSGIILMAILTWAFLGEGITTKTLVSIALATVLCCIQVFWK